MIRVKMFFYSLMISALLWDSRACFSVYTQVYNGPYRKWLILGLNLGVYFRIARVHSMQDYRELESKYLHFLVFFNIIQNYR
jgi:hypothetical protein